MTDSSHVWTPDLGDKFAYFGDEIWDLKGVGIFSISLLGEKIRHECAKSFHVTSRTGKLYKERAWTTEDVLVYWDRLGARTSLEFYPLCELVSC
ncbi:hypothetical protein AVEN_14762-1 [Araneus ventricosus]|uniref:Uncharacterized protein n=1 Tax=Araneus ventricosus TaxID=182803 RepID=A0A4Y2G710_ARAVE|nr:hypothetical protein AVEN_101348-1 [Araneus ventricosus]GBM49500.1 hypothetical protein AVEN_14762-1 [Araneus ventricosus]